MKGLNKAHVHVLVFYYKSRAQEWGARVSECLEGTIKLNDDQGVLKLGKISQEYIDDPDLREILAKTTLDANKMKNYEWDKLLLITSVIYSENFQLEGDRKQEVSIFYIRLKVAQNGFLIF